jgi:hypothetical protein
MLPVVNALQMVVAVQVIQTLALAAAVVFVLRKLKAGLAQHEQRQQQRDEALTAELKRFELQMRAARAESAQYLESVFSGVQGILRNLDATRSAIGELKPQDKARTIEEPRPLKLRETARR